MRYAADKLPHLAAAAKAIANPSENCAAPAFRRTAPVLKRFFRPTRSSLLLLILFLAAASLLPARLEAQRELRVFASQLSYSVPLVDHNGTPYVGLLELLEPLGRVESRVDQQRWRLRFAGSSRTLDVEFTAGSTAGKLGSGAYQLPAEFVLQRGRGLVPVTSLGGLLPAMLSQPAQLTPGDRLLIGNVGFSFSQSISQGKLILGFASPVNPSIHTESGQMRLTFVREPVLVPASGGEQKFSDPVFQSTVATASNGVLQLTVNASSPLTAGFSDGGRTITLTPLKATAAAPVPQPPQQSQPAPAATPSAPPSTPAPSPAPAATAPAPPPPPARPVVVIDAAHGGPDSGAALPGNIAEKELTLELARLLQRDLEARGIATVMMRNSDAAMGLDQRAAIANSTRILAYVGLHAAGEGRGVRVYTALLPVSPQAPTRRRFLPWESSQSSWLELSGNLAGSIAAELNRRQVQVRALASPMRPLNSIWAPAVAVEAAPPEPGKAVNSATYLRTISASISAGISAILQKLEAAR